MKVYYLLVCACFWSNAVQSQFFYSHITPFAAPALPQHYLPLPSPLVYNLPQPANVNRASPPTSSVTYNLPPPSNAEYRGFGYRTDYNDGATSTVFFVTGAESELLRNFQDFPNFARKVQDNSARGRSLASDLLDSNAVPDINTKIQNLLQPSEFQRLFEQPMPGFVNFYTYPADTVPLDNKGFAESNNGSTTTTTETSSTAASDDAVVVEAAESVVNSRFLLNNIDNTEKTTTTASTATTTTEASTASTTETSATASSTESTTSAAIVAASAETTTAAPAETTTLESSTQA